MNETIHPNIFENVPSPFCGLASDDLTIEVTGQDVRVLKNGDPFTVAGFEQPIVDTLPRIRGRETSHDEALALAADVLRNASLPVFSGFGTDVTETRAALSLIDKTRGVFDQMRAEGGLRNLLVLADSGWMATTLGELKNRVEVLVSFGTDIESNFPRFFERFIWNAETLFGTDTKKREIIFIGRAPSGSAAWSPDGRAPKILPCETNDLPQVAAALAALAADMPLQADHVAGIPMIELKAVIDRLKASTYGVVTWAAGQLDFPHAELTTQQLCKAVVSLNATTRCAVLPLGGQDGDRTASQVAAWISGFPTRVSYARGFPDYDPYHNSVSRLLANEEADCLVWVSSLSVNPPPPSNIPTIVFGRSGMKFEQEPDVFIPVGVPGLDFSGLMYRCDNVVAMPMYKLRESSLPRAADLLERLESLISG
jgi:formylmethanofuran dehydrogenase subunit B